MKELKLDVWGYPSKQTLKNIREWGAKDFEFISLMEAIRPIWRHAEHGYFRRKGRTFWLSTAGWSGNESIIVALQENKNLFWYLNWVSSRRGGHFKFHIPKIKKGRKDAKT